MESNNSHIAERLINFIKIVDRLRGPEGCPWDRQQTPATLKKYIIEESYEVLEAIEHEDHIHIKEELGDLLFQIILLARLYQEKNLFSISDVIEAINAKMIRRHPHVFEGKEVESERELRKQWERIKQEEKATNGCHTNHLDSFPKSLPALIRAQKISERVMRKGFKWPDLGGVFDKLAEETEEFKEAVATGDHHKISEELGDILLIYTTIAAMTKVNCEESLRNSSSKFITRFEKMENLLQKKGKSFTDLDIKRLLSLWNEAKKI